MNTDRTLSVALAACCLFALGASAATLDASVDTTPDDTIDLNVETLPLPSDEAAQLKQQIQSSESNPEQGHRTTQSQSGGGESEQQSGASADGSEVGGVDAGRLNAPVADEGTGDRSVAAEPTLFERLLALLRDLLDLLLALVPVAALVGVGVAVVRFRDRLRPLFARLRKWVGFGSAGSPAPAPSGRRRPAPANEVETAWFEMVDRVGLDERTRTPRRLAADAVDAGVDPDDAETLTTLFERVRYGDKPVTAGRRQRARHAIQRVRGQLRGGERR